MLYYLVPFFILAIVVCMMYVSKIKLESYSKFLLFFCLPAILIAILSGDSGTDKESYYTWIGYTFNGNMEKVVYEPGFKYFSYSLSLIHPDVYFIIPVIGLITSILLIVSYSSNKWQMLIFTFYIFPFFYYDMTMNGLRYGLSFALASFAAHQLSKKEKNTFLFFVFSVLAISMQYSSFIIVLLIYLSQIKLKKIHLLLIVVFGYAVFSMLDLTYFDNKVDVYKDINRPSGLSGVAPLILFSVIFIFNWFIQKKISFIFFIILGLEVISFIISLNSYSGLRFQNLVIFTLMLFIAHFQEVRAFKKQYVILFFLIGCISISMKMRNFMSEEKLVDTPFLPYEFYWERR